MQTPSGGGGYSSRRVTLMLSGVVDGYPVSVADYYYQTESTSGVGSQSSTSTTTHYLVVVAVRLGRAGPTVGVAPRHGLARLGRAIFGEGKAAIGYAPFDREFKVTARDPAAARQLIGPVLAAEHLAGRVPAWSLKGVDLLTFHQGRLTDPARIPELVGPLVRVATLLGR